MMSVFVVIVVVVILIVSVNCKVKAKSSTYQKVFDLLIHLNFSLSFYTGTNLSKLWITLIGSRLTTTPVHGRHVSQRS